MLGKNVGPNLSEIGKKLSKEALWESMLFPSAAISHNFENWLVVDTDGNQFSGLLVSETDAAIELKDAKGLVRSIPKASIEEQKKQDISLMPADLQKTLTVAELVDVVEYLTTLKEAKALNRERAGEPGGVSRRTVRRLHAGPGAYAARLAWDS